jgi:hypothetical protein
VTKQTGDATPRRASPLVVAIRRIHSDSHSCGVECAVSETWDSNKQATKRPVHSIGFDPEHLGSHWQRYRSRRRSATDSTPLASCCLFSRTLTSNLCRRRLSSAVAVNQYRTICEVLKMSRNYAYYSVLSVDIEAGIIFVNICCYRRRCSVYSLLCVYISATYET